MTVDRLNDVKAAANGRWAQILAALGIPETLLDKSKHQPCPSCGGKDRFRFTDNGGRGWWICNHCSPQGGSGFDLLMLVYGYDFNEAVKEVSAILGMGGNTRHRVPVVLPEIQKQPEKDDTERLSQIWAQCVPWNAPNSLIPAYLRFRGIDGVEQLPISDDLRFHAGLTYWYTPDNRSLGAFPAMVGLFRQSSGAIAGLHITYLMQKDQQVMKLAIKDPKTGDALPAKKMRNTHSGSLKNAAIRLFAMQDGKLAVCEGIETAIAAHSVSHAPFWACGSANAISAFELPNHTSELFIIADNDANQTGQQAAAKLKRRYFKQLNGKIKTWQPDTVGFDALDVLVVKGV